MMCSENALRLGVVCCFIGAGFGIELGVGSGIVSNVHGLLKELKCPLKLTIVTCWNSGIWGLFDF